MARAGPSRTQRASQSQEPTQTQRNGRTRGTQRTQTQRRDEDEDEEEAEEDEDAAEEGGDHAKHDMLKKVHALVRLALFHEQKRMPLRRDEISKMVMGSKRTAFTQVFNNAQDILRETFGMELAELPTRAAMQDINAGKDDKDKNKNPSQSQANGSTNGHPEGRQTVTGLKKKKAAAPGSKTYILRSTLHSTIIEYAALTDEHIIEEEAGDANSDDSDDETGTRNYGSIIAWNGSDQLASLGILYVILAVILVNGKVISDMDLRTNLRRLRLPANVSIPLSAQSTHRTIPLDAFLSQLVRQGYLDRARLGAGAGKASQGKRGRATQSQVGGDDEATYEWRWGPRAASEVGEVSIARFVAEFMVERMGADRGESDEDEDEPQGSNRRQKRKREEEAQKRLGALLKGVERAAGGDLADVV